MPSLFDEKITPAKILMIGKTGAGKTGALASLVAAGYNLRIVDTDKGSKLLKSLLTDRRYPYATFIERQGIDLRHAVRIMPIDLKMELKTVTHKVGKNTTTERLLAPKDAKAWTNVINVLSHWKDDELDLGPVDSWTGRDVLVFDTFGTLAKCAYYFVQALNGRLGARDEGHDYRRDIGAAQAQLTRLLELIYSSEIGASIIVMSHITWVSDNQGNAEKPGRQNDDGTTVITEADGYPSAIGRALSPIMGKYFNDSYIVKASGSGASVRRTISTVPSEGIAAKNSVYLDREYPISYGLAEIFSQLREEPLPPGFRAAFATKREPSPATQPTPAAVASATRPVVRLQPRTAGAPAEAATTQSEADTSAK